MSNSKPAIYPPQLASDLLSVPIQMSTSLRVMAVEPERVWELRQRGVLFLELARASGLPTGSSKGVSVVPLIVGDTKRCVVPVDVELAARFPRRITDGSGFIGWPSRAVSLATNTSFHAISGEMPSPSAAES